MDDSELRYQIYRHFAETGHAPDVEDVAGWLADSVDAATDALGRLHAEHILVLGADRSSIRMALPFSAVPTPHRVTADSGTRWFANCAWDALAIPVAVGCDATIESEWSDAQDALRLRVIDGKLVDAHGYAHFAVPAAAWWDDIGHT